ncbi:MULTISPECIES: lipoprotein insertase outer membrane protein LolB [unclassified Thioalkalivibrio]|uniref:lipoprotein insertase outer membrane protein LolB n=1 Tax=unclassified Thioalkalivibrio TaxID=2621013 RepID=UPI0003638E84|nr:MULTISPECIES: lipoprotein insertase outer membrane protein LolB [unclassified Thioalkalivibrio]
MTRWASGIVVTLVLVGCTAPMPRTEPDPDTRQAFDERAEIVKAFDEWRLAARLGLSTETEYWSAQLNWRVQQGRHVLDLSGPMGRGGGRLTLAPNQSAVLVTRSGEHYQAEDPDALVAYLTNESIPVSGMRYWVRGLLAPDADYELATDEDGLPRRIEQSGWVIEFGEFDEVDGVALPVRMDLEREGVELRVRIANWHLATP